MKTWRVVLLLFVVTLSVGACVPSANPLVGESLSGESPAGFLLGLWHGFIVMFTFIASLFTDSVGLYEVHNTGWRYDLGFLIGLMMFFGGGGASSKRKRGKARR